MRLPALAFTLPLLVSAAASADTLNVKPGLWETTSTVNTQGTPPIPPQALARMTPEQRAMMEQRMKEMSNKNGTPQTRRECVTQKDIESAFQPTNQRDCKTTVATQTARLLETDITCTGETKATGKLHVEASSPDHVTGTTTMDAGEMHMDSKFEAKWISADCGKTPPSR